MTSTPASDPSPSGSKTDLLNTPESLAGSPFQEEYASIAPNPEDWPTLIATGREPDGRVQDWLPEDIRSIEAPALIIVGDSDIVRPERAVEKFRLLGGVVGDVAGLPDSQLAVLPGTAHVALVQRFAWLLSMIGAFLGYVFGMLLYILAFALAFLSAAVSLTLIVILALIFVLPEPESPGTARRTRRRSVRG